MEAGQGLDLVAAVGIGVRERHRSGTGVESDSVHELVSATIKGSLPR